MTDIVTRLREAVGPSGPTVTKAVSMALLLDAIGEINTLRFERRALTGEPRARVECVDGALQYVVERDPWDPLGF